MWKKEKNKKKYLYLKVSLLNCMRINSDNKYDNLDLGIIFKIFWTIENNIVAEEKFIN